MKNSNLLLLFILFLTISFTFSKDKPSSKSKNKDKDEAPEIISIETNDKLPSYYEVVIKGHFSEKTGLSVFYSGDKIHNYLFKKADKPSSSDSVDQPETKTPSSKLLKTDKLNNSTTPTPSSTPSTTPTPSTATTKPTPTPSVTPTPTNSIPPTTTTPKIIIDYDTIAFNLTDIKDLTQSNGIITISYKTGVSISKKLNVTSTISKVERANNIGGIVEFVGYFFYVDQNVSPKITIGNDSCELLSPFTHNSIRCYLGKGYGCNHKVEISNLLIDSDKIDTYCYANPIIDKVLGYKDNKEQQITILGRNFMQSVSIIIEKPNGKKRNCTKVGYSSDTFFLCELSSSFNTSTLIPDNTPTSTNNTILSFTNQFENTSDQQLSTPSIGYYKLKMSIPVTIQPMIDPNTSTDKTVIDNANANGNTNAPKSDKTKLYLIIIVPTVIFIVLVALVAIFVKTRVVPSKQDNIPFKMLDDLNTTI